VSGRKRHLLVDTQGFLLKVVVSAADVQDRDGGRLVAHALRWFGPLLPRLALVWADAAYGGALEEELHEQFGWRVEIVKRSEEPPKAPRLPGATAPLDCGAFLRLVRRLSSPVQGQ
jgi:putative transposase